jgi:ABC-type glycerol-3-phosphate transport system substrate-binding protein
MRQRSRGLPKALAVLGAAMLVVTACGAGAATQAPTKSQAPAETQAPTESQGGGGADTKLTIALSSSPSATALRAMGDAFSKETGITIEFVDIPYGDIATKVLLAATSSSSTARCWPPLSRAARSPHWRIA